MPKVSVLAKALVFKQLHVMLEAGISISDSLGVIQRNAESETLQEAVSHCLRTLSRGGGVSAGMRLSPEVFGDFEIRLIGVAEKTGALSPSLGRLSILLERSARRVQKIWSSLSYPFCLLGVMMGVTAIFVFFVAPGDGGIFSTLGKDLPWPSRVLIEISRWLTNPFLMGAVMVFSIGSYVFVMRRYMTSESFRLTVDRAILNTRVVGPLVVRLESVRFVESLTSSLSVGLPLMQALANGIETVTNRQFRSDLLAASKDLMAGCGLGRSLARRTLIPRITTSMIEIAEESGNLDVTLERAARLLEEEVEETLAQLVQLLEPLLITVGGLMAGFVAVATILPIIRMAASL